jgi:hypothetical protein
MTKTKRAYLLGKGTYTIRAALKRGGWKWDASRKAWYKDAAWGEDPVEVETWVRLLPGVRNRGSFAVRIEEAVKEAEAQAEPDITAEDRRMIRELATEAGRHIETHSEQWLHKMERAGVIAISRPYPNKKFWSVGIMPNIPGLTDEHGWPID